MIEVADHTITTAQAAGDQAAEAGAYQIKAFAHIGKGNASTSPEERRAEYNKAIKAAGLAITTAQSVGDKITEAVAYQIKALAYISTGNTLTPPTEKLDEYNKAIKAADLAITAAKAAGDKGAEAYAYDVKATAQSSLDKLR